MPQTLHSAWTRRQPHPTLLSVAGVAGEVSRQRVACFFPVASHSWLGAAGPRGRQRARRCALPHEKSAFVLFTNPPPLEVVSNSATRSPLRSCSFAQRTEVASMCSLRQISHEANGGVAVVLAYQTAPSAMAVLLFLLRETLPDFSGVSTRLNRELYQGVEWCWRGYEQVSAARRDHGCEQIRPLGKDTP